MLPDTPCQHTQTVAALPGVLIKLDAAVEAGARVDGPVTTGFALRKGVLDPYVAHRRHLCPRLGAHTQHPVSGRRNNDIGYWQPAGFVVDMSSASAINDAAEENSPVLQVNACTADKGSWQHRKRAGFGSDPARPHRTTGAIRCHPTIPERWVRVRSERLHCLFRK